MRHKHVIGHDGLHGALYYYWKFDTETLTLELERVRLAAGLLPLAFTGVRPGAIFESGCKGIAGTNAALIYKDVKLRLLQPPEGAWLLVLEVTIMLCTFSTRIVCQIIYRSYFVKPKLPTRVCCHSSPLLFTWIMLRGYDKNTLSPKMIEELQWVHVSSCAQ